ncbi:MAG: LegC family aminotransferase [Clostridium sp.]|nr:LegC family aminotransferase [Clostridium sp.]
MDHYIPLSVPNFEGNELKYVNSAVKQGWVSTGGAYITELEDKLAEYINVSDVCACQSGTSAIHLSLMECNVLPGDTVIVPTLTFIAAVNPVKYQFADPYFMDCDDSLCIDPIKLRQFCEQECIFENNELHLKKNGSHVKAIVVVHVFGNLADMEAIMEIAEKYNLKVIEDATEALGSRYTEGKYKGKFAGTIGDFGTFSFNGNKIITTGGGGAVTALDADSVRHIRYKSTQCKDDVLFYIHNEIGFNYRMTNLQAAIGVAQLEYLPKFIERKHKNWNLYKELLKDFEYAKLLEFRENTYSNQWFYSLDIDKKHINISTKELIGELNKRGIQTRPVWGLIHLQKPYMESGAYKIETALYYSERIINIPCSTNLTEADIKYTAENLIEILNKYSCKNTGE